MIHPRPAANEVRHFFLDPASVRHGHNPDDRSSRINTIGDPKSPHPVLPAPLQFLHKGISDIRIGGKRSDGRLHRAPEIRGEVSDLFRNMGQKAGSCNHTSPEDCQASRATGDRSTQLT